MTVLLVLFGAVVGALFGAVTGFFLYIGVGTLAGADNMQGALAMGAAVGGLPLGAVIGAAVGAFLVLRIRKRRTGTTPPLNKKREFWQALIGLTLVAALITTAYLWFTDDGLPPEFGRWQHKPVIEIEIRLSANDPGIKHALARGADLRNESVFHSADGPLVQQIMGDDAILSSRHTVFYKTDDRSIELWMAPGRLLVFDLPYGKVPAPTAGFSDWSDVSAVRNGSYGTDTRSEIDKGIQYRTRVIAD